MRSRHLLLFIAAFLLFLAARLPLGAALALRPDAHSLGAHRVEGTIWNGRMKGVRLAGVDLGEARLGLDPTALLGGRVAFDVTLSGGAVTGSARIYRALGGGFGLLNGTMEARLHALAPTADLSGVFRIDDARLHFGPEGCRVADGHIAAAAPPLSGALLCHEGTAAIAIAPVSHDPALDAALRLFGFDLVDRRYLLRMQYLSMGERS